jgi:tripartite ATP-independent transporter DctP family solute receptor
VGKLFPFNQEEAGMGKLSRGLAALVAAIALLAPFAASAQKTIKVGLSLSKGAPGFDFINGMYELFKAEVESATKGALTVELVYGGALGNPNDRMNQMRRGAIQMSDAADGNYASIYPDIQVLNIPYLFPTEQAAWKVLDGPFGQKIAEDLRAKTGIRVLGWWESGGFKHYSSNRPIHSPADFAGQKIRAMGPLAVRPVEAMKGSASPIAFGELYTSLKTGVVDGQDNAVSIFRLVKLQEVQKYLILTGHTYAVGVLGINDAFYSGLAPGEKAAVDAAAKKSITFNRDGSRKEEKDALAAVAAAGVQVIALTPQQKEAFRVAMQGPVIEWLKTQVSSPKLIDEALTAAKAAQ